MIVVSKGIQMKTLRIQNVGNPLRREPGPSVQRVKENEMYPITT